MTAGVLNRGAQDASRHGRLRSRRTSFDDLAFTLFPPIFSDERASTSNFATGLLIWASAREEASQKERRHPSSPQSHDQECR